MSEAVIIHAEFVPAHGARDALVAALSTAVANVHAEEGCELYAIHEAPDGTVVLIEKWASPVVLAAHGAGVPVAELKAALAGILAVPPKVTMLTPVPAGTAEQGQL